MKSKSQFVCQQCGASYAKWVGQCTNCSAWNSLVEQAVEVELGKKTAIERGRISGNKLEFVKLNTVVPSDAKARLLTEFDDLNTVLGGGILMGSVYKHSSKQFCQLVLHIFQNPANYYMHQHSRSSL